MNLNQNQRIVHHADAIKWLNANELNNCSIITSLPDISEFPHLNLVEWKRWFTDTAELVLSKCPTEGITIFYQSDIKRDGVWTDKGYYIHKAAENTGQHLVSHKIVCRAPVGTETHSATSYSHLLCFSKSPRPELTKAFPDVLPDAGETTWTRGMGVRACELACKMVMEYTPTRLIVDPFCGHGTVLAVANRMGLNAVGVEHKLKYRNIAQNLSI
jgi:hypothetical protein